MRLNSPFTTLSQPMIARSTISGPQTRSAPYCRDNRRVGKCPDLTMGARNSPVLKSTRGGLGLASSTLCRSAHCDSGIRPGTSTAAALAALSSSLFFLESAEVAFASSSASGELASFTTVLGAELDTLIAVGWATGASFCRFAG